MGSLGDRLRALIAGGVQPHAEALQNEVQLVGDDLKTRMGHMWDKIMALEANLERRMEHIDGLVVAQRDELPALRRKLYETRESPAYEAVWREREPLISVRIATWNRGEQLVDGAIASVRRQTYPNFEIVVVGDGCTDDTEARLDKLGDPRVRFVNLPFRTPYPEDRTARWMVAGAPAMNLGAELAVGSWLAPLDDDDEFSDDHLEVLLQAALEGRHELVYGKMERVWVGEGTVDVVGEYPPRLTVVTLQASIYLKLLDFVGYDTKSWLVDEPGDWNLVRRMMEAGVRIGFVDRMVGRMSTTLKHDLRREES